MIVCRRVASLFKWPTAPATVLIINLFDLVLKLRKSGRTWFRSVVQKGAVVFIVQSETEKEKIKDAIRAGGPTLGPWKSLLLVEMAAWSRYQFLIRPAGYRDFLILIGCCSQQISSQRDLLRSLFFALARRRLLPTLLITSSRALDTAQWG